MMQVLELDQAKQTVPARQTEITDFEMHAKAMVAAFLHSVRLNEDAEARIREEFAAQLVSKDLSIADYQEQLRKEREKNSVLELAQAELDTALNEAQELQTRLLHHEQEALETQERHEKQLQDKERISNMLAEKLAAAEEKAQGYDTLLQERDALLAALQAAKTEQAEQQRDFELRQERSERAAEKARDSIASTARDEIQRVEIEAERQLRAIEKEAAAEIRKLEASTGALREEVAKLQAELKAAKTARKADPKPKNDKSTS